MADPPIVLAVYGTLRRGERNETFLAGCTRLGDGFVRGRLFEMPRSDLRAYAYPALVAEGSDRVVVELYALPEAAMLAALDSLEAFDPTDETSSQYVRREIAVEDGPLARASVYLYNGPPEDKGERIPDGDWVAHRARSGSG